MASSEEYFHLIPGQLGLYKEFFDSRATLSDFQLDPSLVSAQRIVSAFYQNNDEYYAGGSRKNVNMGTRQFEAQGVCELSRLPGVQGKITVAGIRDERSSAVEVQVNRPISFVSTLAAVIIPEPYMGDVEIQKSLARWKVKHVETYMTLHNTSGEVWVGQIYEIVRNLYKRLGYL